MLLELFGKLFFPRQAPWLQRKQLINLMAAVAVALVVAAIIIAVMLFANARK